MGIDVGWNGDRRWTERKQMSNDTMEWNDETERTVNVTNFTNGNIAKQSTSMSFAAMACKRKARIFFPSTSWVF
jgi:hypothetical protein